MMNMLSVSGTSTYSVVNTRASKTKYLEYMRKNIDRYPTVYTVPLKQYEASLAGDDIYKLRWGCSKAPYQRVTSGFDPVGTYDYYRLSRHPLINEIRKAISSREDWFSKAFVTVDYKVGERYESNFNGETTISYDVEFKDKESFKRFIREKKIKPKFEQNGVLFDYLELFWDIDGTVPDQVMDKLIARGQYLADPENWYIGSGGVVTNTGEQLHTGASRTSHHTMVKWWSKDGISQGTEDSFWEADYINDLKPWKRHGQYIVESFYRGMSWGDFKDKMGFRNCYYLIDFTHPDYFEDSDRSHG